MRWVGDIPADVDSEFRICHSEKEVVQYFNTSKGFRYQGEKAAIEKHFENFGFPSSLNGFIRVRFIVNCNAEAGRFQVDAWNNSYTPLSLKGEDEIKLLEHLKALNGWIPLTYRGKEVDYYLYLTFKITNGQIQEILP